MVPWFPPSEIAEDVLLAMGVVKVVFTSNHVSESEQMVVDRHAEVHHRVDAVLVPCSRMWGRGHDAQGNIIAYRRVGMIKVGLDHDDRLLFLEPMGEHLLEQFHMD